MRVMVGLLLLSIIGGMALLSLSKVLRLVDSLSYSALVLAHDIRSLQLSSILNRDYSYLYIDFYSLKRYILKYPDSRSIERALPAKVKIVSSSFGDTGYLSFSPGGSPIKGGYVGLSDGKRRLYVVIAVFTGRVRISGSLP